MARSCCACDMTAGELIVICSSVSIQLLCSCHDNCNFMMAIRQTGWIYMTKALCVTEPAYFYHAIDVPSASIIVYACPARPSSKVCLRLPYYSNTAPQRHVL